MAKHPIDMTDVTRPNNVEGTMLWEQYTADDDNFSQVTINIEFSVDDTVVGKKPLVISDGTLGTAVKKAYDVALAAKIVELQDADSELSDEDASDEAKTSVTRDDEAALWSTLKNIVWDGGSKLAERRVTADAIVQVLWSKNSGAKAWGILLLKSAWKGG